MMFPITQFKERDLKGTIIVVARITDCWTMSYITIVNIYFIYSGLLKSNANLRTFVSLKTVLGKRE